MKRKIFRVEQKTGKMPEIAWKTVFEREIDCEKSEYYSESSVLASLRYLYQGDQYRVLLICE